MAPSKKVEPEAPAVEPEAPAVEPEVPVVVDMTTYGTAAEEAFAEREPLERVVLSAGVASDLAMQGWAGDPATGGIFRRDDETGGVTFEPRGGEPRAVEI